MIEKVAIFRAYVVEGGASRTSNISIQEEIYISQLFFGHATGQVIFSFPDEIENNLPLKGMRPLIQLL
jgi:hypothetical protein